MREATGDIWQWAVINADAACVLTNMTVASGKLIMGGGQAREARTMYPNLPAYWGALYAKLSPEALSACYVYDPSELYVLVSFPTKRHPSEDSTLALIENSALALSYATDKWSWETVVLPRPGCGLGGLKWEEVRPVLEPIFDDRFTIITNV